MKVHHLNCGSMTPPLTPHIICHVLLVETDNGLVLVDSGLGLEDARDPGGRFGPSRFLIRPAFDPAEAAITQVRTLGFDPQDVRHIVLTHGDADHVGGVADFPWAQIHVTAGEHQAVRRPGSYVERERYVAARKEPVARWVEHTPERGELWRGFASAEELTEISPGLVLLSLPGHTRGHAAVAVDAGEHWVLHVGDSFYHHGQIDGSGHVPHTFRLLETLVANDRSKVRQNHARLSELWRTGAADLRLINAHDATYLPGA